MLSVERVPKLSHGINRRSTVCSPAICSKCRKVTYSGCGGHVSQVLAKVPPEKRCTCR